MNGLRLVCLWFLFILGLQGVARGVQHEDSGGSVHQWVRQLRSQSVQNRVRAVVVLGSMKSNLEWVIPALIKSMEDSNRDVRQAAAFAIGGMKQEAAVFVPVLVEHLRNSPLFVKQTTILALGAMERFAISSIPVLVELLRSGRFDSEIHWALSKMGPESTQALIQALDDRNVHVRTVSASVLGQQGVLVDQAKSVLLLGLKSKGVGVRRFSVWGLGQFFSELDENVVLPALTQLLQEDPERSVRKSAAISIGKLGARFESALPPLKNALKDPDRAVRSDVVFAMSLMGENAVSILNEGLSDPHMMVRIGSARALIQVNKSVQSALLSLIYLLSDEDYQIRKESLMVIGDIGPTAAIAIPGILKAKKDPREEVRHQAYRTWQLVVGRSRDHALNNLLEAVSSGVKTVQHLSLEALETEVFQIRNRQIIPHLVQLIETSNDPGIQVAVLRVIHAMGKDGRHLVPVLQRLMEVPDLTVRVWAQRVLRQLQAVMNKERE